MCRSCERKPVNPSGGWLSYQPLWKNWITWDRLGWCYYSQLFLESHWKVIFQTANQIKWTSDELQVPWQTLTLLRMVPSSLMDFLIWNASPVNGDIWYLGLPLYVFVASENALFFKSGWCHCFGFGIFFMSSIFPFLMVCIFGLHHEPIPSFGDIFRQSNSQILNYGIVM